MAKITFEDGTVVNFNGNPTQQDIDEVAKKLGLKKSSFLGDVKKSFTERGNKLGEGYLRQQEGKQGMAESVLQTIGQGAGIVGDVAFSGLSRVASAITPDFIEKPIVNTVKSGATKLLSTKPAQNLISGYQRFEENQPRAAANVGAVGNIASLVPIGKGGQIAGKTVLKSAAKAGKAIERTATNTARLGNKISKFGLSQVSGLNRETIEQIIKNPKMFTKEVVADMTRENIGKQIKSGITERINNLQRVGKAYEPLRKLDKIVEVPKNIYTDVIDKYGLKLSNGKLITTAESKPFLSGELKQIEDFMAQYASTKHTPNSALNAREALTNLAKFDMAKSNNLTALAKDLRANLNKVIQDDVLGIPGIKKIDNFYSKEIGILNDIKKDYFIKGTTEFKDNALSKIANLTKEGRQSVLKRLKEIDPNIDFKVNILKALEDIKSSSGLKVGTYTRGGVAAGGLATGNIPLLLGAIAAQPEILVPILRVFGTARNIQKSVISSLEKKLKSGANLILKEKMLIDKAIDDYAKKIGNNVKNIKPGLTIEDVSLKGKGEILKTNPKNFKTAEDYVKAQGTPVYHGTNREFSSFYKANPIEGHGTNGAFGNGFYFTDKPDYAKKYADYAVKQSGGTGRIENVNVNLKNPFIINKNTSIDKIKRLVETNADYSSLHNPKSPGDTALNYIIDNSQKFTDNLKKEGYDGVIATLNHGKGDFKEINVFSPSQIKTKSQLISEWNKAQKLK